jgi:hypothetical protein
VNGNLDQSQSLESHSSVALRCTAQQIEVAKPADKQHAESPSWAPCFSLGGDEVGDAKAESTPPEGDISGTFGKEAGENGHGQGRGLRSKLSSVLSLEKRTSLVPGHASQVMMDMSTPFTRRAPKVDCKISAAIQKETFVSDVSVTKGDPSWTEDKCNDDWGIEPWHSEQRNILMNTLHVMRCDIESLKVIALDDVRGLKFYRVF